MYHQVKTVTPLKHYLEAKNELAESLFYGSEEIKQAYAYIFKQSNENKKPEGKIHLYNVEGDFNVGRVRLFIDPSETYLFVVNGYSTGNSESRIVDEYKCSAVKNDLKHLNFSATREIIGLFGSLNDGGKKYKIYKINNPELTFGEFGFSDNQQMLIIMLKEPFIENDNVVEEKQSVKVEEKISEPEEKQSVELDIEKITKNLVQFTSVIVTLGNELKKLINK